ncbi:hypothetical protein CDCA_CDCA20G4787 [Cyanidium caldarium]|uniref:NADH dehydrogenase [ubiquinone] 1 alpha subcomplex subunit 12 n=1 Tax=Cyanidium caldarium TaxID=2771 RepID=A0AAV9J2H9_CYACA|nr:hypothetical protein CDCA_CDCA20G4787 [Cyanidium caldarium]
MRVSVWSTWVRVRNWMQSRQLVGVDRHGNEYYEEYQGHGLPLRRLVQRAGKSSRWLAISRGDHAGEGADKYPVLWWQWLVRVRDAPPAPAELERLERQQAVLRERVARLEAEDAKLRAQQAAERAMQEPEEEGVNEPTLEIYREAGRAAAAHAGAGDGTEAAAATGAETWTGMAAEVSPRRRRRRV